MEEKPIDYPRIQIPAYDDVDLEILLRDPQTGELRGSISLMDLFEWIDAKIKHRDEWGHWGN